jgi:hypothetical protein
MEDYNPPRHWSFVTTGNRFPFRERDILDAGTKIEHDSGIFVTPCKVKVTSMSSGVGVYEHQQVTIEEVLC